MAKMITINAGDKFREYPLREKEEQTLPGPCITVTDERAQTVLGFGMALTDAACIMIRKMPVEKQKKLMSDLFSEEGMRFGTCRISMGASDYADQVYDFAPVRDDREMQYFDAAHDDRDIIPLIRMAFDNNPELFLFSSSWSPPGWMKTSGLMQGGFMRKEFLDAYVEYYLKFIDYYASKGIGISAVTIQNEAETDQAGHMPACYWHPDDEGECAVRMRRALDEKGNQDIKIWIMDHNFSLWRRPLYELSKKEVRDAVAGIAWHPYDGNPEAAQWISQIYENVGHHWTEGDVISAAYQNSSLSYAQMTIGDIASNFIRGLNSGMQSITLWNTALDPAGYPNVGPFDCRGNIEITRQGQLTGYSNSYYALGAFSRYIRRGARRVILEQKSVPRNFEAVGFENPDGEIIVLVSNTDHFDSPLIFSCGGKEYSAFIRRDSVSVILLNSY